MWVEEERDNYPDDVDIAGAVREGEGDVGDWTEDQDNEQEWGSGQGKTDQDTAKDIRWSDLKGAVHEIGKLGLNGPIFYTDNNGMVIFGISRFFGGVLVHQSYKGIAPCPQTKSDHPQAKSDCPQTKSDHPKTNSDWNKSKSNCPKTKSRGY